MLIGFNILVIAIVLLIAYWWANQGLFSAILHLICVIAAGAIALAVWEPLTVRLLLRGSGFDDYAWGTALLGVFAISLLSLRLLFDKLAPNNVQLPSWANLGFGFPVGAAAGVLTVGICIIGAGFIQSTRDIMGFQGKVRLPGGRVGEHSTLWAPVHQWTSEFYSFLSVGSLYPTFNNTPLRQYNPDLHFQAASLVRDSAANGRAKLSLVPSEARIEEFLYNPDTQRYSVRLQFESGARDFGEQLTLSHAQIRMIGSATDMRKPKVVHPDQWVQYDGRHRFDDQSHFLTSEPGQSQANALVEFPAADFGGVHPRFLQIRNTRYRLPAPTESRGSGMAITAAMTTGPAISIDASAPDIQSAIEQAWHISPVNVSSNQKPPRIELNEDRYIISGEGDFPTSGADRPSRKLVIQGVFEPAGTRLVQVDVSRESAADIFRHREEAGENARIVLVDSRGRGYYPVAFLHQKPDGNTTVKVNYRNYFDTLNKIPPLPTAGGQPLRLYFAVTDGATIKGLKLGEITVGTANLRVRDPKAIDTPPDTDGATGG